MSAWRWLEIPLIVALLLIGSVLGALTGIVFLGPMFAVILPLLGATVFLYIEGKTWGDLSLLKPMQPGLVFAWAALAIVSVTLVAGFFVVPLLKFLGVPAVDLSLLTSLIEGNLTNYLWFLIPVAWGSAAFGEELLMRGYLLYRIEGLSNTGIAVLLQAAIFAVAHAYQGLMGVLNIFVLAFIFGVLFIRCGRNLWPLILAHGAIDTLSLTAIYLGRSDLMIGS